MGENSTDTLTRVPKGVKSSASFSTGPEIASFMARFGREVFCILDAALHCHYVTENWQAISGFSARNDKGAEFKTRIAPDHLQRIRAYLMAGDESSSLRFQIKHSEGEWRWCELQLMEVDVHKPGGTQYKCLLRDVTAVILSQGKLEQARLDADMALKSRSEFLANMSHELRTPLNAILGFAQMIECGTYGDVGHPKYHDYIGNIEESGATLLSKINDLLEIADIDTGTMELRESVTDLHGVIRHAVEFHSHRAFAAQVTLSYNLSPEPVWIKADRIRLLQVLTNLLSNAIKYNRPGGRVDICCETRRNGAAAIIIEDNGGGIMPLHLDNILTAFRQDNSFFARSRDCVGLGLALSKEIIKLHQGRIDIASEPRKGTLITIRLPKERTVRQAVRKTIASEAALSVN